MHLKINKKIKNGGFVLCTLLLSLAFFCIAPACAEELIALDSKSELREGIQYVKHSSLPKFNAKVGAYYYWRIVFASIATDEFYTHETQYHQFTLNSLVPEGTAYTAVLQRKLYAWDKWKDYYTDPTCYGVDATPPYRLSASPANASNVTKPFVTFNWEANDSKTGLCKNGAYKLLIQKQDLKSVYNSGWTDATSYVNEEALTPGLYFWTLYARDNDENIFSQVYTFSLNSSEPPIIGEFIATGTGSEPGYAKDSEVTIKLSASDNIAVSHYYISENPNPAVPDSPLWVSVGKPVMYFSATVPYHLTLKNHLAYGHNLHLWFKDQENNISERKKTEVYVDLMPPIAESIIINSNAQFTLSRNVKLKLSAEDQAIVTGYCVKESKGAPTAPALTDGAWVMNRTFDILSKVSEFDYMLNDEKGIKTLYAWFRDDAGNISAPVSSSILYDTSPPISAISGSIGIKDEQNYISSNNITLILKASASYNNQITAYYISENSGGEPATPDRAFTGWTDIAMPDASYSAEVNFTLNQFDGTHEIYAWFKDSFSNVSSAFKCSAVVDRNAPQGSIEILNNAQWTNQSYANVKITASDSVGVAAYLACVYRYDNDELKERKNLWNYIKPQTIMSVTIPIYITNVNTTHKIFAWVKDSAGNISQLDCREIKLDNAAPQWGEECYEVSKYAGSGEGYQNGPISSAQFGVIDSMIFDNEGSMYVCDFTNHYVRKISNEIVTTVAGNGKQKREGGETAILFPFGLAKDDYGYLYIADGHLVKKLAPDGTVTRYAGTDFLYSKDPGYHPGDLAIQEDRTALKSEFQEISGMCADRYGNTYFSDVSMIRRMRSDFISCYVGNASGSFADGPAKNVKVQKAADVVCDEAGNVYFIDAESSIIRKTTSDKIVSTIAGVLSVNGYADGYAGKSLLNTPTSLCVDRYGNIYVSDYGNNKVRKITPDGYCATLLTSGNESIASVPQGITIDKYDNIYIAEQNLRVIKKAVPKRTQGIKNAENGSSDKASLILYMSDNFSGINGYYLSETPDAVDINSPNWTKITDTSHFQTLEVAFALSRPGVPTMIYAWLKDRAGNISCRQSIKVNEKKMQTESIIGNSAALNNPVSLAIDENSNLYVADASDTPITKFSADGSYQKHSNSGSEKDKLGKKIISLVCFRDGFLGALESDKTRFSFIDTSYAIKNCITHTIDLLSNFHGIGSDSELIQRITDKYSDGSSGHNLAVKSLAGQNSSYEFDFNFSPSSVELYSDPEYNKKINGPISSYKSAKLYVKVMGAGSGPLKNSIIAKLSSTTDPEGTSINLFETGENTNIFTGEFSLGKYGSQTEQELAIASDNKIVMKFFNKRRFKTFVFDVRGQWVALGQNETAVSHASYTSMKMFNGTIYIAFSDDANDKKATLIKYENETWSIVGKRGFSNGQAKDIVLDFYNSSPCVLYSDASANYRTNVMIFDGTKWSILGDADFSEVNASSLAMANNGETIYMAYSNQEMGNLPIIKFFNVKTLKWEIFNLTGLWPKSVDRNCLSISMGNIYYACRDQATSGFLVYKYLGEKWSPLMQEPLNEMSESLNLLLFNETPYVCYRNNARNGLLSVMYYTDIEGWKNAGPETISSGEVQWPSLRTDNGKLYVSYVDSALDNRAMVMLYDNGTWRHVGKKGVSDAIARYACMEAHSGNIYLTYTDSKNGEKLTVLKYEP